MRVLLNQPPQLIRRAEGAFFGGELPARWVACADLPRGDGRSFVWACRRRFEIDAASGGATVRVHVTADQRYELFVDGERVGRGPERGDEQNWFYESYDLTLAPGPHVIVARVWTLDLTHYVGPGAQISVRPGFLLAAEGPFHELLSTGVAAWEARRVEGYTFHAPSGVHAGHFAGGTVTVDGRAYPFGVERGEGEGNFRGWEAVVDAGVARDVIDSWGECRAPRLQWATLPPMLDEPRSVGDVRHVDAPADANTTELAVEAQRDLRDEHARWQAMWSGREPMAIPARMRRRVIVDLGDYYCAYAAVTLSGGCDSVVRLGWAEALFNGDPQKMAKGNRNEILGKCFAGRHDTFIAGGQTSATLGSLWWGCGRYIELYVETADEPLTIDSIVLRETRYPFGNCNDLATSDARFNDAVPIMWRTLQMCSHETYMDCPYYEQLQYTGDTRLEALVTCAATPDDRLPRKAVRMYHTSLWYNGLTQARYPCNNRQIIPQFSLFWVAMLHDLAMWRGHRDDVAAMMPAARCVIETFLSRVDGDGMLQWPDGWSFVDWVPGWFHGTPPEDGSHHSGINHAQLIYTLTLMAELERWLSEDALADRLIARQRTLTDAMQRTFWDASRHLFTDTPSRNCFSEHAQCYMILSGTLDASQLQQCVDALLSSPHLARCTIYAQHYLFEVCRVAGRVDAMLDRLSLWYDLKARGLRTAVEMPEPTRSDCHAWSAHPIFHALTTILGIRPATFGFDRVHIAPQLASLTHARGTVFTPHGAITADLHRDGTRLTGTITLPPNLSGTLIHVGQTIPLHPGPQSLDLPV